MIASQEKIVGPRVTAIFCAVAMLLQVHLVLSDEGNHAAQDRHMLGLYLGGVNDNSESNFAYGFEYEYILTPTMGVGALYEKAEDGHDGDGISIAMAVFSMHPHAGWRMLLGAGREKVHGSHGHTSSMLRFGVGYDFHLGGFGVEPTFSIDRSNRNSQYVYGVLINRKF